MIPLCLRRADARELADPPAPIETPTLHTPAGSERAALVLLGANGISTLALVALAIRQTRQLPLDAETLAFAHLGHLGGLCSPVAAGGRGLAADAGNGTVRGQFGTQLCPGRALRGLAHGNADREPGRLDQSL